MDNCIKYVLMYSIHMLIVVWHQKFDSSKMCCSAFCRFLKIRQCHLQFGFRLHLRQNFSLHIFLWWTIYRLACYYTLLRTQKIYTHRLSKKTRKLFSCYTCYICCHSKKICYGLHAFLVVKFAEFLYWLPTSIGPVYQMKFNWFALWRRGAMDIASASGTIRPGFESRRGIRFLGKHT
jgi:hypothetical protein